MNKNTVLLILLGAVFVVILSFFSSFYFALETTTTQEEADEDGMATASTTVGTSSLAPYVRLFSIIGLIILFYIIIFVLKIKFYSKYFLEFAWILYTPFFFIDHYLNYLFEKLPCPQHHELESAMPITFFLFTLPYIMILTTLIVETLIIFIKEINQKENEKNLRVGS